MVNGLDGTDHEGEWKERYRSLQDEWHTQECLCGVKGVVWVCEVIGVSVSGEWWGGRYGYVR